MPYTSKQKEYIARANKRWNFKSGAVRSGKSYVDVTAVIPMRIRERVGRDIETACAELKLQQIQALKDAGVWTGD